MDQVEELAKSSEARDIKITKLLMDNKQQEQKIKRLESRQNDAQTQLNATSRVTAGLVKLTTSLARSKTTKK